MTTADRPWTYAEAADWFARDVSAIRRWAGIDARGIRAPSLRTMVTAVLHSPRALRALRASDGDEAGSSRPAVTSLDPVDVTPETSPAGST